jgi:hypothetical protein
MAYGLLEGDDPLRPFEGSVWRKCRHGAVLLRQMPADRDGGNGRAAFFRQETSLAIRMGAALAIGTVIILHSHII